MPCRHGNNAQIHHLRHVADILVALKPLDHAAALIYGIDIASEFSFFHKTDHPATELINIVGGTNGGDIPRLEQGIREPG